jgi:polyisoprenoid-binding protein YceI
VTSSNDASRETLRPSSAPCRAVRDGYAVRACIKRSVAFRRSLLAAVLVLFLARVAHAQQLEFVLDPSQTQINFTLGASLHTVHGSFKLKSGRISFDSKTGVAAGEVVVDATSGETGIDGRDRKMHREVLESERYPEIVFLPERVDGVVAPGAPFSVKVSGKIRIHGGEHEVIMAAQVEPSSGQLISVAQFTVPYQDWGLKNPSTFLLRVSNKVDLEIRAVGRLRAATPD